ncbi:hypothetical protein TNCV_286221 [Trichonephila clavipes]|nr:hypothetical protein TNCV_286221 [Trichonephila clavipes]
MTKKSVENVGNNSRQRTTIEEKKNAGRTAGRPKAMNQDAFFSPAWKFHSRSTFTFQMWDEGSPREPYAHLKHRGIIAFVAPYSTDKY